MNNSCSNNFFTRNSN